MVPVAVRLVANCYTPFTSVLYFSFKRSMCPGGSKCPVTVAAVYRGRGASWLVFPASGISHTHCRLKPRDNPTSSGRANKPIDSSLAWSRPWIHPSLRCNAVLYGYVCIGAVSLFAGIVSRRVVSVRPLHPRLVYKYQLPPINRATESCCRQSLTITVINCSGRASELGGIVNLVDLEKR